MTEDQLEPEGHPFEVMPVEIYPPLGPPSLVKEKSETDHRLQAGLQYGRERKAAQNAVTGFRRLAPSAMRDTWRRGLATELVPQFLDRQPELLGLAPSRRSGCLGTAQVCVSLSVSLGD